MREVPLHNVLKRFQGALYNVSIFVYQSKLGDTRLSVGSSKSQLLTP